MTVKASRAGDRWSRGVGLLVAAFGAVPLAFAQAAGDSIGPLAEHRDSAPAAPQNDQALSSLLVGWARWDRAPLTEPLETDRPDFTESTSTVARGHVQLEGGYTFTYDAEKGTRTRSHTAPELLLRAGLMDDLELRIGWDGYTWVRERSPGEPRVGRPATVEDWTQGGADTYLALKWKLFDLEGLRPAFAIIPGITVPTGSGEFSSGDVDPQFKVACAYELSGQWDVTGNVDLAEPSDDEGRFFQAAASVSLAYAIRDDVGAYLEYYGFYPNARDSDGAHTLNTGLAWQLTPNFQLDWSVGGGLNEEADDFFTGVGFAVRF